MFTIYDCANIGNRLQAYAMCSVVSELGHEPVAIDQRVIEHWRLSSRKTLVAMMGHNRLTDWTSLLERWIRFAWRRAPLAIRELPGTIIGAQRERSWYPVHRYIAKCLRVRTLIAFTNKSMNVHPRVIRTLSDAHELLPQFDAFITGSDQVWNPRMRHCSPLDFLTFVPNGRRIAYAASLGVNSLPPATQAIYRNYLSGMKHISLRESTAAEVVGSIVGRSLPTVLDPTLLVATDEWSRLAESAESISSKRFVATYLLYRCDRETRWAVEQMSREGDLATFDVLAAGRGLGRSCGAEDFLRAIRDCEYVVTDSFHATVFSILFGKRVRVLPRGAGQDSRIVSLLQELDIPFDAVVGEPNVEPRSYDLDRTRSQLEKAREASRSWLADALSAALHESR